MVCFMSFGASRIERGDAGLVEAWVFSYNSERQSTQSREDAEADTDKEKSWSSWMASWVL